MIATPVCQAGGAGWLWRKAEPMGSNPIRILGIDPGLGVTGYGLIEQRGSSLAYVLCGAIKTSAGKPPNVSPRSIAP